jgi:hypothetical protein
MTARDTVDSFEYEFLRYKTLAEGAIAQVDDADLSRVTQGFDNSITMLVWHVSGNLRSRFTEFLTSDGEKPWRGRDEEFTERSVTKADVLQKWEDGWRALVGTLNELGDGDLARTVTIRNEPLTVTQALHRSLAHVSYHVGQIVFIAKAARGDRWKFLSILPKSLRDKPR